MKYFSPEYFEELARRLNADAEWSKKAGSLTVKVALTVTDRSTSFLVQVVNGVVTARKGMADEPADFKFEGPYEIWTKIAQGQTDFNTAVITGKMRFRGSLPRIMGIQPQVNRLAAIAKEIPAEL